MDFKAISPTSMGIRIEDGWGSGLWMAPRGDGVHEAVDFLCKPGKPAVASVTPTEGHCPSRPYPKLGFGGISLITGIFIIDLWYIELFDWVNDPRAIIKQGMEIGICQDITQKISNSGKPYGDTMNPHLHMRVRINPEILLSRQDIPINPLVLM